MEIEEIIPATEMVTIRIPWRLACVIEHTLDMARCGVEITDVPYKELIAAAQDLITDAILSPA